MKDTYVTFETAVLAKKKGFKLRFLIMDWTSDSSL